MAELFEQTDANEHGNGDSLPLVLTRGSHQCPRRQWPWA